MDQPITNVVFVSSPESCPTGYNIITECPCGHSANVWVKFLGAKYEERFVCYTKEDKDGKIVEDIYIPGKGDRFIIKGYEVIKKTIEGNDTLNHRYIAMKRVSKSQARKAIYDVGVFRSKDNPASSFTKLGAKLNGLYICIRQGEFKDNIPPKKENEQPKPVSQSMSEPPAPVTSYEPPAPVRSCEPPAPVTSYEPPAPVTSYEPPAPVTSYEPPAPVTSYEPPAPVTSYEPPAPVISYEPPAPVISYDPPAPVRSYEPPAPVTSYEPPAPVTSYEPPAPVTSYEPPAPVKSYEHPAPIMPYSPQVPVTSYGPPPSNKSSDVGGLLLGFEHLDLDQPIPEDHFWEDDDSPPQSPPVNEVATVENVFKLGASAPPSTSYTAPPSTSYAAPPPATSYQLGFNVHTPTNYPTYPSTYSHQSGHPQGSYPYQPSTAYPSNVYPPPTQYGQPPMHYGQPPVRYGQPPAQYGQPPTGYRAPYHQPQYGHPQQYGYQPHPSSTQYGFKF